MQGADAIGEIAFALAVAGGSAGLRSPLVGRCPLTAGSADSIASIGESAPSSATVSRAISAAMSLMRSRSSAFSTRSAAQVCSASRFMAAISCCSLVRSAFDLGELILHQRLFLGEALGGGRGRGRRRAQAPRADRSRSFCRP